MQRALALSAPLGCVSAQSGPWPSDTAFFPHHPSRRVTVLNGTWAFALAPAGTDAASVPYSGIVTSGTTSVPSCFDIAAPGIKGAYAAGARVRSGSARCGGVAQRWESQE